MPQNGHIVDMPLIDINYLIQIIVDALSILKILNSYRQQLLKASSLQPNKLKSCISEIMN